MKKIIGVVGSGMVGRDPFDPRCWSRSGYNLFTTLRERGHLRRAFGVEVPHPLRGLLMALDFHPERALWAQRFNLDPRYYGLLTGRIRRGLRADDFDPENALLQIGGHYNACEASGGRIPAYSYHDGNIAGMMKSPFFPAANLPYARKAFEYEKRVYRDMTKIFVMSEYWKRSFIEDFGVEAGRVVKIGFGVNVGVPASAEKDYSKKNVVFIGIDFSRKGGEHLVAAFRRVVEKHPDARLHIVGPREIPDALKDPGLRNVEFHGLLSRENPDELARLLGLLRDGTLFVLPSLYEPFGNAALEAMLYGMPVIASNDWSFPDFVTPETGLLLDDPADHAAFADKMNHFLDDPDRAARAGRAGRALVLGTYTWERVVANLMREVSGPA
jgi:alpha-maltose-1-phosphate synthase